MDENNWSMFVARQYANRVTSDQVERRKKEEKENCYNYLVDEGGSWIFRFYTWLVSLDVGTETESISNVVDNSQATISITKTIGANFVTVSVT